MKYSDMAGVGDVNSFTLTPTLSLKGEGVLKCSPSKERKCSNVLPQGRGGVPLFSSKGERVFQCSHPRERGCSNVLIQGREGA